jgi:predicted alpha/beta-hydrolase family hydrolase
VATAQGPARAHVLPAGAARTAATLVLGHGAGGGVRAADLQALAGTLPGLGVSVVLVEQPWRVAGRRVAAAPPRLDEAWLDVMTELTSGARSVVSGRLVVGGRSAGARVACRTAVRSGADGVLCLAFPLHPPGRPDRSRADELLGAGVPTLVLQGERDPFGRPAELPAGPDVVAVPYADHSLAVPAGAPVTRREVLDLVVAAAAGFVLGVRSSSAGAGRTS